MVPAGGRKLAFARWLVFSAKPGARVGSKADLVCRMRKSFWVEPALALKVRVFSVPQEKTLHLDVGHHRLGSFQRAAHAVPETRPWPESCTGLICF